jgi:D-alanyl-D-alanine dipeptidase
MGTVVDHLGPEAHIDNEAALVRRGIISMQALANRQLLRKVMKQAGFTPLRSEWWHFNLVSRAEARAHYRVIP